MNLNGTEYFYVRNAQSDIIGLIDKVGTQVVSYTYDSWGKLISTTGTLASTVGVKNSYRYRGYRYDSEIGLYYLLSRYNNPEWGRFINADGITGINGELLSHNMFVYCKNNPVNMVDPDGNWGWLIRVATFIVSWVTAVLSSPNLQTDVQTIANDITQGDKIAAGIDTISAAIPGLPASGSKVSKAIVGNATKAKKVAKHVLKNIKSTDDYDDITKFLGEGKQTNIHSRTGVVDLDRIIVKRKDGSFRGVRMGEHEMRDPNNFHYHLETWDVNGNFIAPDQLVKVNNTRKGR